MQLEALLISWAFEAEAGVSFPQAGLSLGFRLPSGGLPDTILSNLHNDVAWCSLM